MVRVNYFVKDNKIEKVILSENKLEVNIVDEWIEESGILEKYYDLYMKK